MYRRAGRIPSILTQAQSLVLSRGKTEYVQGLTHRSSAKVVSDERTKDPEYKETPGAFPTSALYKQFPDADPERVESTRNAAIRQSSTSSTPAHPGTTQEGLGRSGHLSKDEGGVGWSAAVRHRTSPGEMNAGGEGGLGLMNQGDSSQKE